jgi:hypothetical protein
MKKRTPRCVPSCMVKSSSHCQNTKKTYRELHAKTEHKIVSASDDDTPCALCGDIPCVWLGKLGNVVANDKLEHSRTFGVQNRTRRRVAFRYMFRIINSGTGQKGIRKRQLECIENGIRALFPDTNYREWHSGSLPRYQLHGIQGRVKHLFGRCATPEKV